jgi:hypothetical protein
VAPLENAQGIRMKNYETSALAFAAFLHATSRLRLLHVTPSSDGVGLFVFSDPNDEGETLKKDFEARKCFVEPRVFHNSLRVLRAELKDIEKDDDANFHRQLRRNQCRYAS